MTAGYYLSGSESWCSNTLRQLKIQPSVSQRTACFPGFSILNIGYQHQLHFLCSRKFGIVDFFYIGKNQMIRRYERRKNVATFQKTPTCLKHNTSSFNTRSSLLYTAMKKVKTATIYPSYYFTRKIILIINGSI